MRKLTILRHIISLMLIVVLGFTITYSWFARSNNIDPQLSDATIIKQYFHTGSGTEEDPFVITRPVHYYNLVQLFQRTSGFAVDGDSSKVYYFQLGYELDNTSEGLEFYNYDDDGNQINTSGNKYSKELNLEFYNGDNALLPIGTSDIPFNDVFNGSGLTVKNLHVKATETVGDVTFGTADIGIFGFVTEEASISNVYYSNFDIDLTGTDYTRTVSSHNIDVHDTNDTGTADVVYVGYVAGHIVDATCFSNFYINSCEIIGQTSSFRSDWGYFGYCENAETIDEFIERINGGQGSDAGWGGSFISKDYTALAYSIRPNNTGTWTKQESGPGGYNMSFTASSGNNPNNYGIVYRLRDGSYVPLKFNNDGKSDMMNTGYLVGSNVNNTGVNASPKISSYRLVNIGNALSDTAYNDMQKTYSTSTANITYTDNKLEVLTYYNGQWVRIQDEHNSGNNTKNSLIKNYSRVSVENLNFVKYNDSRNALQELMTDQSYVHGIHFDNNQVSISNLLTIPANTARINGIQYDTTYQVPKGSINFNLKESGVINFFAGTYNSSNVDLNFFSLYEITRNGGNISKIKEIVEIFQDADDNTKKVYKYSDNTYSAGRRGASVFNVSTILKGVAPVKNMLYYFELPVNSGEYAMGVAGSTQGAYMVYLDLCANANNSNPEQIVVDNFATVEYRSASDTIENNILILTFNQNSNLNVSVKVVFDKEENCYSIFTSANIPITVTILDSNYTYKFNNITISSEVGSYTITSP